MGEKLGNFELGRSKRTIEIAQLKLNHCIQNVELKLDNFSLNYLF